MLRAPFPPWRFLAVVVLCCGCRRVPGDDVDLLARLDEASVRTDSLDLEFLAPRWNWHQNGWLEPGREGRERAYWMRKREASIDIPLFSASTKELVLGVRCHPRLGPGLPVSMALNGSPVGEFVAGPTLSDVQLTLPGRSQRPGLNQLSFSVPRRYEPGRGDADRVPLAVAVERLSIRPSQEPRSPAPVVPNEGELRIPPNVSVGFSWQRTDPSRVRLEVAGDTDQSARVGVELASDERRVSLASLPLPAGGRLRRELDLPAGLGPLVEIRVANVGPGTIRVRELKVRGPERTERQAGASLPGRPNIVLFLVDTLRSDDLGAYGSRLPTSPEFDRFAAEGMLFEHATAQSAWTRPTVASLFTGLHAGTHGVEASTATLAPEVTTLAESLRDRGYATVGLVANDVVSPKRGFAQGFANWNAGRGTALHGAPSDVLARMAVEALETIPEPFFLYVHTLDPHDPYEPSDADWQAFRVGNYRGVRDPRQLMAKGRLEEDELGYLRSKYRGEIRHNDSAFGALLSGLRSRGALDHSIVIFTSDHGEEFFDHGGLLHRRTLYDEILRVPLAVRLPGGRGAGRLIGAPFRQVDLFPTLASLVGAEAPKEVEGTDHSRAWVSASLPSRVSEPMAQLVDEGLRKFALRSGDLKLIVNADARGYWRTDQEIELYDLRTDPGERTNLFYDRPVAAHYLRTRLARLQVEQERRRRSGSHQPLSSEEREQLRALGYVQ